jgi:hypothetical protein
LGRSLEFRAKFFQFAPDVLLRFEEFALTLGELSFLTSQNSLAGIAQDAGVLEIRNPFPSDDHLGFFGAARRGDEDDSNTRARPQEYGWALPANEGAGG